MSSPIAFTFPALGTVCGLQFDGCSPAQAALWQAMAEAEVERIERKYSRYLDASELSRINRSGAGGGTVAVDDETAGLLDFAFACYDRSGGLFDVSSGGLRRAWTFAGGGPPDPAAVAAILPRVGLDKIRWARPVLHFTVPGMELDFGGIGKEYAVDRVAEILAEAGAGHALVDLGGDMRATGPRADGHPWRIGIRDPFADGAILGAAPLAAGALATSGDYERCIRVDGRRYGHILNPKTGWPVSGMTSVTVLADQCMLAGALCTIAVLMEGDAADWLSRRGQPHLWVNDCGGRGGSLTLDRSVTP